jgi:hypothetical protein
LPGGDPSVDLRSARDLADARADLSPTSDLSLAPDLSVPADLSMLDDLSINPDLSVLRSWVQVAVPNDGYVQDISGWSNAILLALSGRVASFDGTTWTTLLDAASDPTTYQGGFNSVYAASPTEYYATIPLYARTDGQSLVFAYDGTSWTQSLATPDNDIRLYRLESGEMAVVGQAIFSAPAPGGTVHLLQNGSWSSYLNAGASDFAGFWGTSPTNFYASGWASFLGEYSATGWEIISSGTLDRYFFTWGTGNDVYTGGNGIFRYDGTTFTQVAPGGVEMYDVWGVDATHAYAVGCKVVAGDCAGTVLYYFDGMSWSMQPAPNGTAAQHIWGRSDTDLWLAVDGLLYHSE